MALPQQRFDCIAEAVLDIADDVAITILEESM
jgi:hypothetical protein